MIQMVRGILRREKQYVEVYFKHSIDDPEQPSSLSFEDDLLLNRKDRLYLAFDGNEYEIEDIIGKPIRAAAMIVGGYGRRYRIVVKGRETFMWYDGEGWFVQKKIFENEPVLRK